MTNDSPIRPSGGDIARWGFIIAMSFSMLFFPRHTSKNELRPVIKGPRPHTLELFKEEAQEKVFLIRPMKNEHLFYSIIHNAADKHRIDPALVKAVIMAESGYNPEAVSKKGAVGLMQLMPATANALGVEDLYNPEHNIHGGVKYLKQLLRQFEGDLRLAIAAYQVGTERVKKYQGIPPFKTTHNYIKKVFTYYKFYKKQSKKQRSNI
ncbi:MAG: lytic transglycosylase domain-containing protein [Pseudomonadota bacterium]